jgi:hypothetical protein
MIEQDKAAIELMDRFAEIWSYTIDPDTMKVTVGGTGDKALQHKFAVFERRFDAANDECHKPASMFNFSRSISESRLITQGVSIGQLLRLRNNPWITFVSKTSHRIQEVPSARMAPADQWSDRRLVRLRLVRTIAIAVPEQLLAAGGT